MYKGRGRIMKKMNPKIIVFVICILVFALFFLFLGQKNRDTEDKKRQTKAEKEIGTDESEESVTDEGEVETTGNTVTETAEKTTEEGAEETTEMEQNETAQPETLPEEESRAVPVVKREDGSPVVTMSFVGDIYLSPMMEGNYDRAGISGVISPKIQEIFQSVDIAVGDHEYVCGNFTEADRVTYQQYSFLCPPEREQKILKDFSFDVMTLANNHTMDYKEAGLLSTMTEVSKLGIRTIGGGKNLEEALQPYTAVVAGKKIAVLSATRVVPQTDWYAGKSTPGLMTTYESTERFEQIKQEITRLKTEENYDIVIMYVHWGNDGDRTILQSQRVLGHGYIDAGADMVIGNHTHKLQGMEFYQGKMIVYGLSNFLFGSYHSDTMVLQLEILEDNQIRAKVLPCTSEGFYTQDLQGEAANQLLQSIESMSENVNFDADGTILQK